MVHFDFFFGKDSQGKVDFLKTSVAFSLKNLTTHSEMRKQGIEDNSIEIYKIFTSTVSAAPIKIQLDLRP